MVEVSIFGLIWVKMQHSMLTLIAAKFLKAVSDYERLSG
jgi:hypothetical protein